MPVVEVSRHEILRDLARSLVSRRTSADITRPRNTRRPQGYLLTLVICRGALSS